MTRLLAFGDVHLSESAPYGPPGEFLREQEAVLERIVQVALEEQVDAVLVAGDVWNKRAPTPSELLAFARPMDLLDGIPVVAITGNHCVRSADLPVALDLFNGGCLTLHRRPGIHRFGRTSGTQDERVSVACLPWSPLSYLVAQAGGGSRDELFQVAAEHLIDVARGLRDQIDGPAVLLGHWACSGSSLPSGLPVDQLREVVLPLVELEEQGWDAVILGHIHKAEQFGDHVLYVGSPMPLNFAEGDDKHGVWIIDTEDTDFLTFGPTFRPVESRPFLTIDREAGDVMFNGFEGVDGAIIRYRYSATREEAASIDQRAIRQALLDAGAWHVQVEASIVREQTARVAGLSEDVDAVDAMGLWLAFQGITGERVEFITARAREYMEAAR